MKNNEMKVFGKGFSEKPSLLKTKDGLRPRHQPTPTDYYFLLKNHGLEKSLSFVEN